MELPRIDNEKMINGGRCGVKQRVEFARTQSWSLRCDVTPLKLPAASCRESSILKVVILF
jgi:hypothetical protein